VSAYGRGNPPSAVVVGRAAGRFGAAAGGPVETRDGHRRLILAPDPAEAERWARRLTASGAVPRRAGAAPPSGRRRDAVESLDAIYEPGGPLGGESPIAIGPAVASTAVIDLAARVGLEALRLRLP